MNHNTPSFVRPTIGIEGTEERFPVRRIYCVGRNYRAHAIEMGADPDREDPFFFMKPADAIVENGSTIPYPKASSNVHHEIELVVAMGKGGVSIGKEAALDHVWGYGVGNRLNTTRYSKHGKESRSTLGYG